MHIAVFGAGSVGGYAGGMMAKAGLDVTLLDGWHDHIMAMRTHGLKLSGTQGEHTVPVQCLHLHEVHRLARKPVDLAILAVKSYDTAWITTMLQDYLAPGGFVLSMQNGMNEETIARVVGWERVAGCVLNTIGVEATGPGAVLRWMEPAPAGYSVFRVGEVHGGTTRRALAAAEALGTVDNAVVTANLWGERWSKLVNNATASGIGPLTGMSILEMFSDPVARRLSIAVGREGVKVGLGSGFNLEKISGMTPDTWVSEAPHAIERIEAALIGWQKRFGPEGQASTLHDIRRGRRTEIDTINGLIARQATKIGMAAPLNAALTEQVKRLERGEITQGRETVMEIAALAELTLRGT